MIKEVRPQPAHLVYLGVAEPCLDRGVAQQASNEMLSAPACLYKRVRLVCSSSWELAPPETIPLNLHTCVFRAHHVSVHDSLAIETDEQHVSVPHQFLYSGFLTVPQDTNVSFRNTVVAHKLLERITHFGSYWKRQ